MIQLKSTQQSQDTEKAISTSTRSLSGPVKCYLGTVGGALSTGLAGGAAGSVIPIIGTGGGAVTGAVAGGMIGAAASC
ncbi:hypothetical protein [Macrococcus animalis]|uniref:hypothetical protein n=1 Tax=Macrococcus animalis TaxID=3395467 RepID=UPI0039BE8E0A